jgi:hypothetical protein
MTILALHALGPGSPIRPPNWRWRLAKLLSEGARVSKSWLDHGTDMAEHLLAARARGPKNGAVSRLDQQFPGAREAYAIYRRASFQRWEIEARLLADEDSDRIAAKCGCAPKAIDAFHDLFFEVRPRLADKTYICAVVLGTDAFFEAREHNVELLLKMGGYIGGAAVLDRLVDYFNKAPVKLPRHKELDEAARQTVCALLTSSVWIHVFTTPFDARCAEKLAGLQDIVDLIQRGDPKSDRRAEVLLKGIWDDLSSLHAGVSRRNERQACRQEWSKRPFPTA